MKLEDMYVGQHLITGRQGDLADGKDGSSAYVVGIGRYTGTWHPCGLPAVQEVDSKGVPRRVVCAVEEKDYRVNELLWRPKILAPRNLMDPAEYRVKADVYNQYLLECRAYDEREEMLENVAVDAVRSSVLPRVDKELIEISISKSYRRGRSEDVHITITVDDPEQLPLSSYARVALRDLREFWGRPSPRECRRG